jgi:hypothetical protein
VGDDPFSQSDDMYGIGKRKPDAIALGKEFWRECKRRKTEGEPLANVVFDEIRQMREAVIQMA